MVRFDRSHGHGVVGGAIGEAGGGAPGGGGVGPAGVGAGECLDLILGVGGDGISGGVELGCAVSVEEVEAHGEELHELAGVVLVGDLGGAVHGDGFVAVEHVEIGAHAGGEGDVLHDGGEVAEGVVDESVLEGDDGAGVDGVGGDDEHLGEGEGDALAKLVGCCEGGLPPLRLRAGDEVVGARGWRRGGYEREGGRLRGELLVEVAGYADGFDVLDVGEGGAEGGLVEQAGCGGDRCLDGDLRVRGRGGCGAGIRVDDADGDGGGSLCKGEIGGAG